MGYNISDEGGESSGSGDGGVDVWTFTLTKGDGITTGGGDFNEDQLPIFGVPPIDESLGRNEYEFLGITGDPNGAVTFIADGVGGDTGTNATGIYSFSVDFSLITEDTTVEIVVIGRRLDENGDVEFEDDDTIVIELLICIARGTLVDTPEGPVPVETLAVGSDVRLRDGRVEPIRWIGSRRLNAADLRAHPHLRPIRIARDAFAPGEPDRDLLVSPQHRVLLRGWQAELFFGEDEVLAPARGLVNDDTIRVDHAAQDVAYFHLLFSEHEVMVTNNLPTESFFPGQTSLDGIDSAAREELFEIFPELAEDARVYGNLAEPGLRMWEARTVTQD